MEIESLKYFCWDVKGTWTRIREWFHCCSSIAQSCLTLCDPMDCSTPGFPVLHCLPEFAHNWCPLSHWCYLTISSSAGPLSFCLQFFSTSGSFSMSQLFTSGSQSIGASASASVLPMNIQSWFSLELTGLVSLQSKGVSSTTVQKHQFFCTQPFLQSNSLIHTWLLEKSQLWLYRSLLAK